MALGLLGFAWIAIDPKKRGWHDIAAGTVVLRRTLDPRRLNDPVADLSRPSRW